MIGKRSRKKDPTAAPPYLAHFALREAPFANGDTRFFYADPEREQALNMLLHLTQYSEELLLVSGPAGAGKSKVLEQYLARADEHWKVCRIGAAEAADAGQMFVHIAQCFGLDAGKSDNILEALQGHLQSLQEQQTAVLVVDDAHAISDDALEIVLRLAQLTGEHGKLLRVILFAEASLLQRLEAERFSEVPRPHQVELKPLDEAQVGAYLQHRMAAAGFSGQSPFTPKAIKRIHKASQGLPGGINREAHQVLVERMEADKSARGGLPWRAIALGAFGVVAIAAGISQYDRLLALFAGDKAPHADAQPHGPAPAAPTLRTKASPPPRAATPIQPIVRLQNGSEGKFSIVLRPGQSINVIAAGPGEGGAASTTPAKPEALQQAAPPKPPQPLPPHGESKPAGGEPAASPPKPVAVPDEGAEKGGNAPSPPPAPSKPTSPAEQGKPAATPQVSPSSATEDGTKAKPGPGPAPAHAAKKTATGGGRSTAKASEPPPPAKKKAHATKPKAAPPKQTKPAPNKRPIVTPVIRRIEPNPVTGSHRQQTITLVGSGFGKGMHVTVHWPGHSKALPAKRIRVVDPHHLQVRLTTGVEPATWLVEVANRGRSASATSRFRVVAPKPAPAKAKARKSASTEKLLGATWVRDQSPTAYTVQIFAANDTATVNAFLQRAHPPVPVARITTRKKGKRYDVLLQGRYPNRKSAEAAAARLPAAIQKQGPWVRPFGDLQKELTPTPPAAHGKNMLGATWVRQRNPAHFTLQLAGGQSPKSINGFLDDHPRPDGPLALVRGERNGKPWYTLLYGDFADRAAAERAMQKLPAPLRAAGPWRRSFASVRQALAKSPR